MAYGHPLRLNRKIGHPQALILEGVVLRINAQRQVILECLSDGHQAICQPIAQAIAVEQGHHHVDIGLKLQQTLTLIGNSALPNALERDIVLFLERLGERDKIL